MGITKKRYALVVSVILALCLVFASGCARNDESVMRDTITERLDTIKSLDDDVVEEFSSDMDLDVLSDWGVEGTDFTRSYLTGFDYTIDDIDIDGDVAHVIVTLTCKSYADFIDNYNERIAEVEENEDYQALSDNAKHVYVGEVVMEALDAADVAATDPITIEFTYNSDDNAWVAASDSFYNDIMTAMMRN